MIGKENFVRTKLPKKLTGNTKLGGFSFSTVRMLSFGASRSRAYGILNCAS